MYKYPAPLKADAINSSKPTQRPTNSLAGNESCGSCKMYFLDKKRLIHQDLPGMVVTFLGFIALDFEILTFQVFDDPYKY